MVPPRESNHPLRYVQPRQPLGVAAQGVIGTPLASAGGRPTADREDLVDLASIHERKPWRLRPPSPGMLGASDMLRDGKKEVP
jgi:hypothetical protein